MLVLKRKVGEQIVIDGRIVVKLLSVNGGTARLGFDASDDIVILREELRELDVSVSAASTKEVALV